VSNETKIGIAVAAVALLAVLWFAGLRPGRDEQTGRGGVPSAGQSGKRGAASAARSKSDRAKERLAQLRAERMGGMDSGGGQQALKRDFPGKLPGSVFDGARAGSGSVAVDPNQPPAPQVKDEDYDFETLRDMALIDENPDNRAAAIWLLASLEEDEDDEDGQRVFPVLTQALSDEDPEVRMAAIQALSEFSEDPPIESLQTALQDTDAEVRFEALSIAAEMTDDRVQPLIQQALDDPDEDVRSLAEGLADMEDTYAAQPTGVPTPGGK